MLHLGMVVTLFGVDMKHVKRGNNNFSYTPSEEALLTFVGGFVESNYTTSPLNSETFVVGVVLFANTTIA